MQFIDKPSEASDTPTPQDVPKARGLGQRSASGILVTLSGQGLKIFIQLSLTISLARLLSPQDFGIVAVANTFAWFLYAVSDIGLGQAVVQKVKLSQLDLSSTFWVIGSLTLIFSILFYTSSFFVGYVYPDKSIRLVMMGLSPCFFITGLSVVHKALLTREGRFKSLVMIDLCSGLFGALAGISAALAGAGFWSLVVIAPIQALSEWVVSWWLCRWRPSFTLNFSNARSMMTMGGYVAIANLGSLVTTSVDNLLIGARLGSHNLGLYDQGFRLINQAALQLLNPVSRVMIPLLVGASRSEEPYAPIVTTALRILIILLWPALIVGAVMPASLVTALIGVKWLASAPVFGWFCLASLTLPLNAVATWLILAQNRLHMHAFNAGFGAIITLLAVVAGLSGGISAVARNIALVQLLLIMPFSILRATRQGQVTVRALLMIAGQFSLVAIAVAGVVVFGQTYGHWSGISGLIFATIVSYIMFIAVMLSTKAGRTMIEQIHSMLEGQFRQWKLARSSEV